jgi:hypothetical protein
MFTFRNPTRILGEYWRKLPPGSQRGKGKQFETCQQTVVLNKV